MRYDATTEIAGVLMGDTAIARIQGHVQTAMLDVVSGLSGTFSGLYGVGVSVAIDGTLEIDEDELDTALADNFDEVERLFAATGQSSHSKIQLVLMSSDTVADGTAYDVDITQAATRGSLTGVSVTDPAVTSLVVDATNDSIALSINGVDAGVVQLTHGTYTTGAALATEIQTRINEVEALLHHPVTVSFTDEGATGRFVITSTAYGAGSQVALGSAPANSAHATLGLQGGSEVSGTDVQGTINGETATGSGRLLTGDPGNATTDGVILSVSLAPSDLVAGAEGSITLTRGVAGRTNDLLTYLTDSVTGSVKLAQDSYQRQIDNIESQIDYQEDILARKRARLEKEFLQLERALQAIQTQSQFLTQQLSQLP